MNEFNLFSQTPVIDVQDIHSSWIRVMPNGELIEKLRKSPSAQKPLTDFIQQYIFLEESSVVEHFEKVIQQSSPEILNDIVLKAGATLLSNKIRLTITKKEVIQIKESLGEALYSFSINQAPSIHDSVGLADVNTSLFDDINPPLSTIVKLGYKSLRMALGNIDNPCIYKLPKSWDTEYTNNVIIDANEENDESTHKALILTLLNDPTSM